MRSWLPPLDQERSAWTGYTREHWEAAADHLLDAVIPHAAPDFAQFRLPGRASWAGKTSDGLEGFARTFLLAAFRIAGARGEVRPELIERYASGLEAGTTPDHPFAWPAITDRSQQVVEAASIAIALHETRPWIFDRLPARARERVVEWLAGTIGVAVPECNWVFFPVVAQQFLANVGGPHDPEEIAAALGRAEEWYVGDGWYTDGPGQNYDYYAGWAMHLYPLLWTRMARGAGTSAAQRYRSRLRRFLRDYQHFFASDGAPVHQGRSLTYRFAAAAPLWMGALADATPLPPGRTRRIASGVLRHFVEHGAPDGEGLLRLGWYHEFLPVTQPYSGPASPYWASKGFLGLLLPPDHPVWTGPEEPSPVDTGDQLVTMPGPGWLLHSTSTDGVVRLVNHGSDHAPPPPAPAENDDPHYVKLGYASHAAPETGTETGAGWGARSPEGGLDGYLSVLAPDGTRSRRRRIERLGLHDRFAASVYSDRIGAATVSVQTASVLSGAWEIRVHRVDAPAGFTVREGGYALAADTPPVWERGSVAGLVRTPNGLTSALVGVSGWAEARVARATGGNAYGPHSATPYLLPSERPGRPVLYVSVVVLTGVSFTPDSVWDVLRMTKVDDLVILRRTDLEETMEVRLGARPGFTLRRGDRPEVTWSGFPASR